MGRNAYRCGKAGERGLAAVFRRPAFQPVLPKIIRQTRPYLDVPAADYSFASMIDEMDRRILSLLQQDARLRNAEIARPVGMAPSAKLARLRKLEERGVILGYGVRVGPA